MTPYVDLYELDEDDRILVIGKAAESGKRTAFFVDDDAKADRYIKKLTEKFKVEVVKRMPAAADTILVVVERKAEG